MKLTKLQAAVLNQLSGSTWFAGDYYPSSDDAELYNTLSNIANNGADAGWVGFTYYAETCQFALDNWSDIVELCREMIDGCYDAGTSLAQFIAGFNCMQGYTVADVERVLMDRTNEEIDGHTTVLNALAWFALEETAHAIVEE